MSLFCTSFPALVAVAAVLVFKDDLVVVNKICLRTPCPAGVNVLLIIGHLLQVPPSNQISSYQLCFWCPRSYIEIFVMLLICVGWAKNEATPTPYIGVNIQPRLLYIKQLRAP